MTTNITSTKINNNITVNTIPGYPTEMVILKAYIYAKPWIDGENYSFLTLFSMIPVNEYKSAVDTFKSADSTWPRTNGVFVSTIGSISRLIPTKNRVGLRGYQDHLEQNGWYFIDTVSGIKGEAYETARKMSFAHIQRLKKKGIEISIPEIKEFDITLAYHYLDLAKKYIASTCPMEKNESPCEDMNCEECFLAKREDNIFRVKVMLKDYFGIDWKNED